MFNHPQSRYYPAVVRIGGQPRTILSDDDLILSIRETAGDDVADLLALRLSGVEEMPDKDSVLRALRSLRSDAEDVVNAIDNICDQFDK